MKTGRALVSKWFATALLIVGLAAAPGVSAGSGRWVMHQLGIQPRAANMGGPTDAFSVPGTEGHWMWVVWYDNTTGQWAYDHSNPYDYSNGTVRFRALAFDRWYYVLFYDTVTGVFY